MKFEKIIYMETIPTVAFGNVRMGVEGTLMEGESLTEAYHHAKECIKVSYKSIYGESPQNGNNDTWDDSEKHQTLIAQHERYARSIHQPIPTKDISEDPSGYSDDEIINMIWECNSAADVAKWKYVANQNERVRKEYLNKLKQFV